MSDGGRGGTGEANGRRKVRRWVGMKKDPVLSVEGLQGAICAFPGCAGG